MRSTTHSAHLLAGLSKHHSPHSLRIIKHIIKTFLDIEFNRTKIFVGTNRAGYCIFPLPRQWKKSGAAERVQKGE